MHFTGLLLLFHPYPPFHKLRTQWILKLLISMALFGHFEFPTASLVAIQSQLFFSPFGSLMSEKKKLLPDDRVSLFQEQIGSDNFRYMIKAERKILTVMGQEIWVDVENLALYYP